LIASLLASGNITLPILLLTFLEAAGLYALHRRGRGIGPAAFLPSLLAGDFLLLAWLADAHQWDWRWIAVFLLGALMSHLTDMARRLIVSRRSAAG